MKARTSTVIRLTSIASLFGIGLSLVFAAQAKSADTIDVLVLYTPGTSERYNGQPETRINHLFNVTNQAYRDSGVALEIRPVHMQEVGYPDNTSSTQALYDMTRRSNAAFTNVEQWRAEYGADMVLMYRPYSSNHGNCGVAWIGGNKTNGDFSASWLKSYMYSHVSISTCGDYVTAHELGHNMGLNHSRRQDGTGATFDYALGHGVYNNFVTLMAYQASYNVDYWAGKIYKFSSPNLVCKGLPCGVDKNDPVAGADAVSTLKVTTPQIARYFPTKSIAQPIDSTLTKLKTLLQQRLDSYNQLQNAYNVAVTAMNARRAAYLRTVAAFRQKQTGYVQAYAAFRTASQTYILADRKYRATLARGSKASRQAAYSVMITRRNVYLKSYNNLLAVRNAYFAVIAELRSAATQFQQAVQLVVAKRNELNQARQEFIAARQAYLDAGGVA